MINQFQYQDEIIETTCEPGGDSFMVAIKDRKYRVAEISPGIYEVESDNKRLRVCCIVKDNKSYLDLDTLLVELTIPSEDGENGAVAGAAVGEKDKIFAPMPGKVVKLLVAIGDAVKEKQPMVIVEAMKMEHQVNALAVGVVKKINFADGDQVDTETPIIELDVE
jgi:biotin carboxyl carrier protein